MTFSPSTLEFYITINKQTATQLLLKNISEETLAFKVKTTCVQRYSVRPSASSLNAGEDVIIHFGLRAFNEPPSDLNNCQDRFLLLITPLSSARAASELSMSNPAFDNMKINADTNGTRQSDDNTFHGYNSIADFWAAVPSSAIMKEKIPVNLRLVGGVNETDKRVNGISGENDVSSDNVRGNSFAHVKPFTKGVDMREQDTDYANRKVPTDNDGSARLKLFSPTGVADVASAVASHLAKGLTLPTPILSETTPQPPSASSPTHPVEDSTTVAESERESTIPVPRNETTRNERVPGLPGEECIALRPAYTSETTHSLSSPRGNASTGTRNSIGVETDETSPNLTRANGNDAKKAVQMSRTTEEPQPWPPASAVTGDKEPAPSTTPSEKEIDYSSMEYAHDRVLQMNVSHPVIVPELDREMRQLVAVERAGELQRIINEKTKQIESVHRDLIEARHRLSDARMATRPSYDVRYELNESGRIPIAQICIMAIISGALLQLLV